MGERPTSIIAPEGDKPSLKAFHPVEMARQMCLLTSEVYSKISSSELLQKRWLMAHKTLLSPSILNMQMHEHRMKNWFCTQILAEVDRKARAVMLSRVIVIAGECLKLHNFSGAVIVLEALEDPSIKRLKHTWTLIPSMLIADFENVKRLVDKNNAYEALVTEMTSTAVPGVPFIGALLSRIEDLEERLPYILQERKGNRAMLLSLSKIRLVGNLINQVVRFQTHAFNFEKVPKIREFLTGKAIDDLALLRVSLSLEGGDD